ncbi:MAG: hypothetical protein QNJ36_01205 [Calothrix sp. MO_167.B42]|nr:hypothetical protein [Calothrix sp. MO_167.B42]
MQGNNNNQSKFETILQALELNQQMQRDWEEQGIVFIDSYVEDVEGDWLEKWGEDETLPEQQSKIALLARNATRMPQLFAKVGSILERCDIKPPEDIDIDLLINKIIDEFARIISSRDSSDWLFNAASTLEKICLNKSDLELATQSRSSLEQDTDDWLNIAEELLDEVEETWDIPETE